MNSTRSVLDALGRWHSEPRNGSSRAWVFAEEVRIGTGFTANPGEMEIDDPIRMGREQRIDASSVGIYYFLSKPEGTQVTEVKVNDLGQFEPETLPEGFFTEELEEAFAYSKILAKRSSGGER